MSRPIARHTYERRARIRRTILLRRRRQVQRASMVALSVVVLLASGLSVFFLSRTLGAHSQVEPLFVVDPSADASALQAEAMGAPVPAVVVATREISTDADAMPLPSPSPTLDGDTDATEPAEHAAMPTEQPITDGQVRDFNGRQIKPVKTMRMLVTAYSPDARSCGIYADGITASGYSVWTNGGKLVAADTRVLPFGSLLSIPGYDNADIVPVLDVGGAIKGNRLDVLFPTHEQARQWGKKWLDVVVYDFVD